MSQFKRAQLVMLSTKNESKGIYLNPVPSINKIHLWNKRISNSYIAQHLCIISDDEIKEGDKVFDNHRKVILECPDKDNEVFYKLSKHRYKKIIATTDISLNKKHDCDCGATTYEGCSQCLEILPQPSQQFIEKFIEEYNKGNIITEVFVEQSYTINKSMGHFNQFRVYKLKVNPKDNTITIKKLKDSWNRKEVSVLAKALEKIIEMNYQHAEDQYGDKTKAEGWSCVKVAKEALQEAGY